MKLTEIANTAAYLSSPDAPGMKESALAHTPTPAGSSLEIGRAPEQTLGL